MMNDIRVGTGCDVHPFQEDRRLIIGGVEIDHPRGLAGHSDADVLLHAITDALFGALALVDIGSHFPDHNSQYKNIDSRKLLRKSAEIIRSENWNISNIDATVIAQEPKLAPFIDEMRSNIAADLSLSQNRVSVKATTSEGLGFVGKKEGISAQASALLWKE
jgi:2-C-methyl-D-erythritol 2,4-cyclodiphosphate synthase